MASRTRLKKYLERHGIRSTARQILNPNTGEVGRDPSWLCRLRDQDHRDVYVVKTARYLYLEEVRKV